ncbi:MAG TPA: DUF1707 domain-containing protein [Marmoricola sp.]|jgi:hypothetical protein
MDTRYDPDRLRIADTEREAAVTALGEHFAVGRLTREEYDERCEAAWAARTRAELRPLFADLPGPHQPGPQPGQRAEPVRSLTRPRAWGWWPVPLLPVLLVLLGISVLTHLPVILFGLAVWLLLSRGTRCRRR